MNNYHRCKKNEIIVFDEPEGLICTECGRYRVVHQGFKRNHSNGWSNGIHYASDEGYPKNSYTKKYGQNNMNRRQNEDFGHIVTFIVGSIVGLVILIIFIELMELAV